MMSFAMLPATNSAQSATDRDAVLNCADLLRHDEARDVDGARKIMMAEGRFYAMDLRKPKSNPQSFTGEEYFARLQTNANDRERIWNPDVRVHESIAAVWAPYDFWIDGKFSHCGTGLKSSISGPFALGQVFTRLLWTARTAKRRDNRRLGIRLTRRSHAASAL